MNRMILVVGAVLATFSSLAVAQTMPQKPFSQWTQAEQQALAASLKAKSDRDCNQYVAAAQGGSQRATYEAAACMYGTFFLGVPADYPNREQYKQQFYQNSANAKSLGSNAPFLKTSE